MHKALVEFAEQLFYDSDSVKLVTPDTEAYYINSAQQIADGLGRWGVTWEGGPFQWSIGMDNTEGKWGYFDCATSWSIYANN